MVQTCENRYAESISYSQQCIASVLEGASAGDHVMVPCAYLFRCLLSNNKLKEGLPALNNSEDDIIVARLFSKYLLCEANQLIAQLAMDLLTKFDRTQLIHIVHRMSTLIYIDKLIDVPYSVIRVLTRTQLLEVLEVACGSNGYALLVLLRLVAVC